MNFRGPDGGDATDSPEDVVTRISWTEAVSGWVTTAGVNTALAREDRQAVVAAYPDARVTYQLESIYRVTDYLQGIEVQWLPNFYAGTVNIRMSIFVPTDPPPLPPLPEQITYVHKIDLEANKTKGKRQIRAWVGVRDQTNLAAEGATVFATWTFPDGSTHSAESVTFGSGNAYFDIGGTSRGTYTLTVDDIVLEDHRFDSENSVLSGERHDPIVAPQHQSPDSPGFCGGGMSPSCVRNARLSQLTQVSTIFPSSSRCMMIFTRVKLFPVAGISPSGPVWVPFIVETYATRSPSAIMLLIVSVYPGTAFSHSWRKPKNSSVP